MFIINRNLNLNRMTIISQINILSPLLNIINKKTTNIDAIDCFTNNLVQRKTLKWEILKLKSKKVANLNGIEHLVVMQQIKNSAKNLIKEISDLSDCELCIDINNLKQNQIDNLLLNAIQNNNSIDLIKIFNQCYDYKKLPTNATLMEIMNYTSKNGNRDYLNKIINFCKELNINFYNENFKFDHYTAVCLWSQGNSMNAIETLKDTYVNSSQELRKVVRQIFKDIVNDTVNKKSQAVLIAITEVAQFFATKYNDYYIVACIWRECFSSEWQSDRELANSLYLKYLPLQNIISKRTNYLCYKFLRDHDTGTVHRLVELFLKHKMHLECKTTLEILFDYQYWCRNLKACSEIIRTSVDLGMPLDEAKNEKLLILLLKIRPPAISNKKSNKDIPTFEIKF